ncbi:MAG: hypothetical protein J4N70_06575, partial [Chloroflexi bacterium]|nr:hypothetical protein [Chloroflexota bacterium]
RDLNHRFVANLARFHGIEVPKFFPLVHHGFKTLPLDPIASGIILPQCERGHISERLAKRSAPDN